MYILFHLQLQYVCSSEIKYTYITCYSYYSGEIKYIYMGLKKIIRTHDQWEMKKFILWNVRDEKIYFMKYERL